MPELVYVPSSSGQAVPGSFPAINDNFDALSNQAADTAADVIVLASDKADKALVLTAGVGLDGGGDLSADRTFDLDAATQASLDLADTAVQPDDIGTAAAEDVEFFATAAQGATADTALQPGDAVSELVNDAEYGAIVRIAQSVDDDSYSDGDFGFGETILAVTYAGAATVRLPYSLSGGKIVSVKDEAGTGDITVVIE